MRRIYPQESDNFWKACHSCGVMRTSYEYDEETDVISMTYLCGTVIRQQGTRGFGMHIVHSPQCKRNGGMRLDETNRIGP